MAAKNSILAPCVCFPSLETASISQVISRKIPVLNYGNSPTRNNCEPTHPSPRPFIWHSDVSQKVLKLQMITFISAFVTVLCNKTFSLDLWLCFLFNAVLQLNNPSFLKKKGRKLIFQFHILNDN